MKFTADKEVIGGNGDISNFCQGLKSLTTKTALLHSCRGTIFCALFLRIPSRSSRVKKPIRETIMKKVMILLIVLMFIGNLYSENKDYIQWWISNHGDYAKTAGENDPRVQRTFIVFNRVKTAADKLDARLPHLLIIPTRGKIYARALPDGGIIINPDTLDVCYNNVAPTTGDQRMAFILGHELAHLANNDYLHHEVSRILEEHGSKKSRVQLSRYFSSTTSANPLDAKKKELLADRNGAFYAAMAGYNIGVLFNAKSSFFTHWAAQTGIGMHYEPNPRHPSFAKRVEFIRLQLQVIPKHLELFNTGVLLYQMGNYHDSEDVFLEFAKIYPARDVFNNIGICNLKLALRLIKQKYSDDYYRFKPSTTIDYTSTARKMTPRFPGGYLRNKQIVTYLDTAVAYLKRATERDILDNASRHNLSATLILKQEYAWALSICNNILRTDPKDIDALNNKAIALYYYGEEENVKTAQHAIQLLEEAHRLEPGNSEVLFNLSTFKEKRMRLAGARLYWEKFLLLDNAPTDDFYVFAFQKLRGKEPPIPKQSNRLPEPMNGIKPGAQFTDISDKWRKQDVREFKLGVGESDNRESWVLILKVVVENRIRVIALDNTVEIVEKELVEPEPLSKFLKNHGPPQRVVKHTGGNFYVYLDRGFSTKEIKGKVCSYIWFEKGF